MLSFYFTHRRRTGRRLGASAGLSSVWMYAHTAWEPEANRREFTRSKVRRSLRLLERPRARECKQTCESTKCTNRVFNQAFFESLHLNVVNTARISSTLMCSGLPRQCQPHIVRYRHRREGKPALNRWYLRVSSLCACSRRSSPFPLTKPVSLPANLSSSGSTRWRSALIKGRSRNPCNNWPPPGMHCLMSCLQLTLGQPQRRRELIDQPSYDKDTPRISNQGEALILPNHPSPLALGKAVGSIPPAETHEHLTLLHAG